MSELGNYGETEQEYKKLLLIAGAVQFFCFFLLSLLGGLLSMLIIESSFLQLALNSLIFSIGGLASYAVTFKMLLDFFKIDNQ